jgi:Zn-dependent protease with chaperone function
MARRAKKEQTSKGRKRFPKLDPLSFQHPLDVAAIRKLDRLPGLQRLIRKLSLGYTEKMYRMLNVSENIRVTPKQFPKVYEMFREACAILDIPDIPEIYIRTYWHPNAFSFGVNKYTVTLLTGTLDLMTEDELLFVIGHELTHIKCNHMMYKTLLYLLTYVGAEIFGFFFKVAKLTLLPLEMRLRNWERKAEFSCDRGGLLVVQNLKVAQTAQIKMAGASKSLLENIDVDEVLKQADDLRDMDEELLIRAMKVYHNIFRTHPFPIIRIKELHNWSQSDQHRRILKTGV